MVTKTMHPNPPAKSEPVHVVDMTLIDVIQRQDRIIELLLALASGGPVTSEAREWLGRELSPKGRKARGLPPYENFNTVPA